MPIVIARNAEGRVGAPPFLPTKDRTMDKNTVAAVDLTALLPIDTAVIEILHNGNPTGWKITLAGPSHPKAVEWNDKNARKSLHRQKLIEQAQVNGKKYQADERTPEEARQENVEWLVARIIDWTPVSIGGTVYSFDQKTATDLLIRPDMGWAFVQILEWFAEDKAFMPRSAKT